MKHNSYLNAKWFESYYELFVYRLAGDSVLGYYPTYPHPTRDMSEQAFAFMCKLKDKYEKS